MVYHGPPANRGLLLRASRMLLCCLGSEVIEPDPPQEVHRALAPLAPREAEGQGGEGHILPQGQVGDQVVDWQQLTHKTFHLPSNFILFLCKE